MSKFKVGDKVIKARSYEDDQYCRFGGDEGEVPINTKGIITKCGGNGDYSIDFEKGVCWNVDENEIDLEKLINEKTMKDIKDFDKKALNDAKKEIAKERADAQKEKAKDILREIYAKKDTAEEVIKSTEKDLEKIDESLKVFNTKK